MAEADHHELIIVRRHEEEEHEAHSSAWKVAPWVVPCATIFTKVAGGVWVWLQSVAPLAEALPHR